LTENRKLALGAALNSRLKFISGAEQAGFALSFAFERFSL
jgi:hypothetical protein